MTPAQHDEICKLEKAYHLATNDALQDAEHAQAAQKQAELSQRLLKYTQEAYEQACHEAGVTPYDHD